jgi:hypothetical protein
MIRIGSTPQRCVRTSTEVITAITIGLSDAD